MKQPTVEEQPKIPLWFDLSLTDIYASWKGRLIINWPSRRRLFWGHADKNEFPVHAILEDSELNTMPKWYEIDLKWEELSVLPPSLKSALSQWRGIYYIFDTSDNKGYVGSAYGDLNLLQRWEYYAKTGSGGNRLLLERNQSNFRFTILELVSPTMKYENVINLEESWKQRLHTIEYGLNLN